MNNDIKDDFMKAVGAMVEAKQDAMGTYLEMRVPLDGNLNLTNDLRQLLVENIKRTVNGCFIVRRIKKNK